MTLTKELFWKFVRFGVVGFSGMIVDYAFLFLFVKLCGLPDLLANAFSFTLAASSNYFLNRIWTFRSPEEQVGKEYLKFFLVSLVGLGINTLTIFIFELFIPEWKANSGHGFHFIVFIEYFEKDVIMAFRFIVNQFRIDDNKRLAICHTNQENGKLGGRPPKTERLRKNRTGAIMIMLMKMRMKKRMLR